MTKTEKHNSKGKSIEDSEDRTHLHTKTGEITVASSEDQTITSLSCDDNNERVDTVSSSVPNLKTSSRLKKRKVYSNN